MYANMLGAPSMPNKDILYIGLMPRQAGRPLAISYDFRPLFYVKKSEKEYAIEILEENFEFLDYDPNRYKVISVDGGNMEAVVRKRGPIKLYNRNPNHNFGLISFQEWARKNDIDIDF